MEGGKSSLDLLSTIRELVDLNPHTGPWNALGVVQETGSRKDSAFALGTESHLSSGMSVHGTITYSAEHEKIMKS